MKRTWETTARSWRPAVILTVCVLALPFFLAPVVMAAEIRIERPHLGQLRIVSAGDSNNGNGWHIQYGTSRYPRFPDNAIALPGPAPVAYFSHRNWLRRIDTNKGIVTGRWRFPASIIALELAGRSVRVEVEERSRASTYRSFDFDLDNPQIPYWPTSGFSSPTSRASLFDRPMG